MASKTQICNMALSHLGNGTYISNVDTDSSAEALACRTFYDICLEAVLRDFPWPFATKISTLALIEEDPNDEYSYSYRYPTDCLLARKIQSGTRNDSRQSRIHYRIAKDGGGRVLFTDVENAILEYTEYVTETNNYPPDFVLALSYRLASYISARINNGDLFKLGERSMQMYRYGLGVARANSMNEQQAEELPDSEFIRIRE